MKKDNAKRDLINFLEHYLTFYSERYGGPVHYGAPIELEHTVIINKALKLLKKYGKNVSLSMFCTGPKY